jgi:hypothetical protein
MRRQGMFVGFSLLVNFNNSNEDGMAARRLWRDQAPHG